MATPEHILQNEIRNALAGRCLLFRANVGQAWQGEVIERRPDGTVVLANARPFSTGLPPGFSDLFGLTKTGRFIAAEVKTPTGRVSPQQAAFLAAVERNGGAGAVVRSVAEAVQLLTRAERD